MTSLDALLARGRRRDVVKFAAGGSVVEVEFEALRPADYEALSAAHTGADGELDRDGFLPALAAACAVEDDDPSKWAALVADGLSAGEANALYQRLLLLNFGIPAAGLGKG